MSDAPDRNPTLVDTVGGFTGTLAAQIAIDIQVDAEGWSLQDEGIVQRIDTAARAAIVASAAAGHIAASALAGAELSIVLADDAAVQALNRDFRGKDKPTNVLSFPMADEIVTSAAGVPIMLGDVVLAVETVAVEARSQGKPFADHVTHLVVHGVLHLLGHTHDDDADADRMEAFEVAVLSTLGVPDPYQVERESAPSEP